MTKLKPPFAWYGGKTLMADWIIPHFPAHTTYVEPFGGSAAVLFAKKPSKVEVYNDLHSGVVNFYRVLRDRELTKELVFLLERTPYSREEFNSCKEIISEDPKGIDLNHAWAFFVCARQCFGGGGANGNPGWGYDVQASNIKTSPSEGSGTLKLRNSTHDLVKVSERLRKTQIEKSDAIDVINRFDTKETLFYVDPPYVESTGDQAYKHKYTDKQHIELLETLNQIKGMCVLSGFDSILYEVLGHCDGWEVVTRERVVRAGLTNDTNGERTFKTECLWISPNAMKNQVQGTLF